MNITRRRARHLRTQAASILAEREIWTLQAIAVRHGYRIATNAVNGKRVAEPADRALTRQLGRSLWDEPTPPELKFNIHVDPTQALAVQNILATLPTVRAL